jgi:hypothetical protein
MNKKWYVASMGSDPHNQGLVADENTGENIAVTYKAENTALVAAAPKMLQALEKSAQNIKQLCDMVNTLAGFKKVRVEDFDEQAQELIYELKS